MEKVDVSVFDDAKKDVSTLLSQYPSEKVEEAVLYVVDAIAIGKLREMETLLTMEYSQYDYNRSDSKKKRGRPPVEKYSLSNIVKVINFDNPANSYQTYISESWKQINDRDKIKKNLDAELDKHKHRIKKFTLEKLKKKGVSKDIENEILKNIEGELKEAEKEKDYICTHFDKLDIRISSYYERVKYAALRWYVKKKKQEHINLRKQVPNVLWLEELSVEELIRSNNELIYFLDGAKRAFGDVFYKPLNEVKENE